MCNCFNLIISQTKHCLLYSDIFVLIRTYSIFWFSSRSYLFNSCQQNVFNFCLQSSIELRIESFSIHFTPNLLWVAVVFFKSSQQKRKPPSWSCLSNHSLAVQLSLVTLAQVTPSHFFVFLCNLSKWMFGPAHGRGDMTFPQPFLNRSAKGTMESKVVGGGHFQLKPCNWIYTSG